MPYVIFIYVHFFPFQGMLESGSVRRQDATLRCLEMLLHRTPSYWKPLLSAGAVAPLVALLGSNKKIKRKLLHCYLYDY